MSDSKLTRFFSVFEKSVQDEILDFCRRISDTKADIYIFLARKAAVFCECLEELGQIHLDGYVTSDRSLDIDGKWLEGKSVVLIDDAVVSGTTLYSTIRKLEEFGVKSVTIQILTINEQWYNPKLLENDEGKSYVYPVYNKLPDNICIKLCNDIVQAVSLMPRPYDVDFPLFRRVSMSEYELKRILVLNDWNSHDIRTERQKENHIINNSLMPNKVELRELSNAFGFDITKNCIVKIRIYGQLIDKAKKTFSVRIAPMIVFHEMEYSTVQQIFDYLVSTSADPSLFADWSSTSQLRLLQFYYSNQLAMFWLYRVNHIVSFKQELSYSYRNLSFLFPKKYILPIENLCRGLVKIPDELIVHDNRTLRERNPVSVYHTIDPISINARLYEPFLDMYHEKELPCRRLVVKEGKKVFENPQYKTILNRLNEGMSYQDLIERLRDCINDYDVEQKVSEFIDRSIDAGIIVPIIQQVGTTIFRAYRHGEDVLFGHREELMYRKMLSLYAQHSGSTDGITRIETEKLLVLFTKVGLKKKILYPYTSNFTSEPLDKHGQPIKILRVKSYLKGQVSLVGSALQHQKTRNIPFITAERKSLWLTNLLLQNGSLKQNNNKHKYEIRELGEETESDIALLTEDEQTFVQDFSELTGRISNPNCDTGTVFDDNDWAKISVTLTLPDTATAVAAEMEIFYNDFDIIKLLSFSGDKEADFKEINYFLNSHAFECVHSAVMKIESFSQKRGQALISAVRFPSNVEQRTWLGYFSEELGNNTDENNKFLKVVFYEQKVWSYLLQSIINALYLLFIRRHKEHYQTRRTGGNRKVAAQSRMWQSCDALDQLRRDVPQNAENAKRLFDLYDQVYPHLKQIDNSSTDSAITLTAIRQVIDCTESVASNIKEIVCDMLGERGKVNDILVYNYAVHINLNTCPETKKQLAQAIIEQALKQELQKIEKDKLYAVSKGKPVPELRIDELPQKIKPIPQSNDYSPGIWYVAHGSRTDLRITSIDLRVASFAMNVFYGLYQANIGGRITIFDRLDYDTSIRSNTSENAEYHCNQFNTLMERFKENVLFPCKKNASSSLIHVSSTLMRPKSRITEKIQKSDYFRSIAESIICGPSTEKGKYNVTEYRCIKEMKVVDTKTVDFGIITILPEELGAIQSVFQLRKLPYKFGERIYHSGKISSKADGLTREIVCTQALGQGETSVVNAYHDMMHRYRPKIVFLIGIAGGVLDNRVAQIKKDGVRMELDLCDVVIARSVVDYELRKETADGIEHRGQCYNVDASVAAVVNEFLAEIQTNGMPAVKEGKNDTVNVLFEAIGSGNAVIANRLSTIVSWLKEYNSKVAAVEMEATGISSAFYESFAGTSTVKGLLVVRGISDLADVDKELCKAYRIPAAQNAALVAKRLMEVFPALE